MTTARRRWFAFSLRTLFVVLTVIGGALGWLGYQLQWIQQRHAALAGLGEGAADMSLDPDFYNLLVSNGSHPAPLANAPWTLRLLGESGVTEIFAPWPENGPEVCRVRELFPEAKVQGIAQ